MPKTLTLEKVQSVVQKAQNLGRGPARYDSVEWATIFTTLGCYAVVEQLDKNVARHISDYAAGAQQGVQKFLTELAADKAQKEFFKATAAAASSGPFLEHLFSEFISELFADLVKAVKAQVPGLVFGVKMIKKLREMQKQSAAKAATAREKYLDAQAAASLTDKMATAINEAEKDCRIRARAYIYELSLVCATQSKKAAKESTTDIAERSRNLSKVKANIKQILRLQKKFEKGKIDAKTYQKEVVQYQKRAMQAGLMEKQGGQVVVDIDEKERSGLQKMAYHYFPVHDKTKLKDNVARELWTKWWAYKKRQSELASDLKYLGHWEYFYQGIGAASHSKARFCLACSRVLKLKVTPEDLDTTLPPAALKKMFPHSRGTNPDGFAF